MEQQVEFDLGKSPCAPMLADNNAQRTDAGTNMGTHEWKPQAEPCESDLKFLGGFGTIDAGTAPCGYQLSSAVPNVRDRSARIAHQHLDPALKPFGPSGGIVDDRPQRYRIA